MKSKRPPQEWGGFFMHLPDNPDRFNSATFPAVENSILKVKLRSVVDSAEPKLLKDAESCDWNDFSATIL